MAQKIRDNDHIADFQGCARDRDPRDEFPTIGRDRGEEMVEDQEAAVWIESESEDELRTQRKQE